MQLYTIKQAAEKLQVSERTVNDLIKRGDLACINVSVSPLSKKPRKRIRNMDLETFLQARTAKVESRHERNARLRNRRRNMRDV